MPAIVTLIAASLAGRCPWTSTVTILDEVQPGVCVEDDLAAAGVGCPRRGARGALTRPPLGIPRLPERWISNSRRIPTDRAAISAAERT